jgi:hypothetical protein
MTVNRSRGIEGALSMGESCPDRLPWARLMQEAAESQASALGVLDWVEHHHEKAR